MNDPNPKCKQCMGIGVIWPKCPICNQRRNETGKYALAILAGQPIKSECSAHNEYGYFEDLCPCMNP